MKYSYIKQKVLYILRVEKSDDMEMLQKIALAFTIIGALNWGLIGLFDYNLVTAMISNMTLVRVIYSIIAICGLINIGIYFYELHRD